MDSSDEEAILFSLKLSPRANQKKGRRGCANYFFKKRKNKEFTIIYGDTCQ